MAELRNDRGSGVMIFVERDLRDGYEGTKLKMRMILTWILAAAKSSALITLRQLPSTMIKEMD